MVELTMVLATIGLLVGVAMPRFGNSVALSRADAASRRLIADIALAQATARATSKTVRMTFSGTTYSMVGVTSTANQADTTVNLGDAPYYATAVSATLAGNTTTLSFDLYGTPDVSGTIRLVFGTVDKTLTIDPNTGVARVP